MRKQIFLWGLLVRCSLYNSRRCPHFAHLAAEKAIVDNKAKVTEDQLLSFLNICWTKYVRAKIEPGKPLFLHNAYKIY